MSNDTLELIGNILVAMKDVLLGGAGGVVAYLFDYTRQKKSGEIRWSNGALVINMVIGAFVAYSLGSFIPFDMSGRDGIIGFIGVSSFAILGIIESRFAKFILEKTIGVKDGV